MARSNQTAETPKCPICGNDMPIEYVANFEYITGRAEWHLPFAPRMKMCGDCNGELIKAMTRWYNKVNATGAYDKPWVR
nr:MAG TPA_asm: HNH endonuclease [Caudoviricetes sp.]